MQKLLNGRKLRWETLEEIDSIIDKQIRPYIEVDTKRMIDKVKKAYGRKDEPEEEIETLE